MPIWLKPLLVAFLVINGIFWGLFPHRAHCKVAGVLGVKQCASHSVHITFGIVCAIAALVYAQWDHFYGNGKPMKH